MHCELYVIKGKFDEFYFFIILLILLFILLLREYQQNVNVDKTTVFRSLVSSLCMYIA